MTPPLLMDPTMGRLSYERLEPALKALPAHEVERPRLDLHRVAIVALRAVAVLEQPENQARIASLPEEMFDPSTISRLQSLALAAWYARNEADAAKARRRAGSRLAELAARGAEVRWRMTRVVDYHFPKDERVQAELASIREGRGYIDLASDLTRLARLYELHAAALAVDRVWYRPEDVALASACAEELLMALEPSDAWPERMGRIWTLLKRTYAGVQGMVGFAFKGTGVVEDVPSLCTAARRRRRAASPK